MSFDTEVVKDGRGRAIRVDISVDRFSSISYRYGSVAGALDGTNLYSRRVLELGAVRRGFGQANVATSGATSLTLDNADGGVDWLCGAENIATASKVRFRVYVVLYDPSASPLSFVSKLLGEFVLGSWPEQDNETVQLQLADDMLGALGPGLLLPTVRDWKTVGAAANNPLYSGFALPDSISEDTPVQLVFGGDFFQALPHILSLSNATYAGKIIVPLYSTTDLSAASDSLVDHVFRDFLVFLATDQPPVQLEQLLPDSYWTVEKSATITKGGRNFKIVYLVVDTALQSPTPSTQVQLELLRPYKTTGGYPPDAVDAQGDGYLLFAVTTRWMAQCWPGSQVTNPPAQWVNSKPVDVLVDLTTTYSSATVDSTSATRVKAAFPNAQCAGVVQPWTDLDGKSAPLPLSLRQVITSVAQSSDIDVFINWDGEVAFSAALWDFTTATMLDSLVHIREEELIGRVRRKVPSNGERHAPFNRLQYNGARLGLMNTTSGRPTMPFQGPWDIETADIALTDRVIEKVLEQGWCTRYQQNLEVLDPNSFRILDATARDVVTFRTSIAGLRLDLGDHFKLSWTRGSEVGGPYIESVFQCEAITYSPQDEVVEITAVWRDDITTERQYLLDDETLLVRAKGGLSGNAIFDGSEVVEFDGTINLTTMGVVAGDVLVLRSSTEAEDEFTFNAAYLIQGVSGTIQVSVLDATGAAPTLSGPDVPNAEWSIVRGATTYPTAISDPTNYPSGSDMYGKMTDASGDYSDTTQGNRLING